MNSALACAVIVVTRAGILSAISLKLSALVCSASLVITVSVALWMVSLITVQRRTARQREEPNVRSHPQIVSELQRHVRPITFHTCFLPWERKTTLGEISWTCQQDTPRWATSSQKQIQCTPSTAVLGHWYQRQISVPTHLPGGSLVHDPLL